MPTKEIIDENCMAADLIDDIISDSVFVLPVRDKLCSGCNYCEPCTAGIPISSCMQAYNHKILVDASGEKKAPQALANEIFIRVRANGTVFPDLKRCIGCRACEKRCTQKIEICKRMHWLEAESKEYGYDNDAMRSRLAAVGARCSESKKIAVWPAADYASRVLDYWNNKEFEERCVFVNASPAMWGKRFRNKMIISPEAVETEGVDTIVILHHRLQSDIYNEASARYSNIKIVCLHEASDIDWFNRMI